MLVNIIDDDALVARALARCVARAGWETRIFNSAEAFLTQLDALPFGCVLLDIEMPGLSGLDLILILRSTRPEWPVVIVTGQGELSAAVTSFRHGAVDFIQKPFRETEILSVLREAAEIGARRRTETLRREEGRMFQSLTNREVQVLRALANGIPGKNIAWRLGISPRTVEMHRSNILIKLRARNTSHAVTMAHRCDVLGGVLACEDLTA